MDSEIEEFFNRLHTCIDHKAKLYDGYERDKPIDCALRLATEELGEVSSAITRERITLAKEECIDLAHCALLIYIALSKE